MTAEYECVEYVWLDADYGFRSKMRVLRGEAPNDIPDWNYDGSSTGQGTTRSSEVILKPRFLCRDPFRRSWHGGARAMIAFCDTYEADGTTPTASNNRYRASRVFNASNSALPWFGLEQEYYLGNPSVVWGVDPKEEQGRFYCGVGARRAFGRPIAEEHAEACLFARLRLSGINAEVGPGQWEFQIGPVTGIEAADQLWTARYLLERVAERHGISVDWTPKPHTKWNGSGCHANYSTEQTRTAPGGMNEIADHITRLSATHTQFMYSYGEGNKSRMTGDCETASYDKFSWGVGARDVSVRIGNETKEAKKGYYEDRRPASNCDPYLVTSLLFKTTVVDPITQLSCDDSVSV